MYVTDLLKKYPSLRKWSEYSKKIIESLVEMLRKSPYVLKDSFLILPKGLFERILENFRSKNPDYNIPEFIGDELGGYIVRYPEIKVGEVVITSIYEPLFGFVRNSLNYKSSPIVGIIYYEEELKRDILKYVLGQSIVEILAKPLVLHIVLERDDIIRRNLEKVINKLEEGIHPASRSFAKGLSSLMNLLHFYGVLISFSLFLSSWIVYNILGYKKGALSGFSMEIKRIMCEDHLLTKGEEPYIEDFPSKSKDAQKLFMKGILEDNFPDKIIRFLEPILNSLSLDKKKVLRNFWEKFSDTSVRCDKLEYLTKCFVVFENLQIILSLLISPQIFTGSFI